MSCLSFAVAAAKSQPRSPLWTLHVWPELECLFMSEERSVRYSREPLCPSFGC